MSRPPSRPLSDRMKAELAARDYSEQARKTARSAKKDGQSEFNFDIIEPLPTLENTRKKLEEKKKKTGTASPRPAEATSMKVSIGKKKVSPASTPRIKQGGTSGGAAGGKAASRSSSRKKASSASQTARRTDEGRTLDHVARSVRARSRTTSSKPALQPTKVSRKGISAERVFIILLCVLGVMAVGLAGIIFLRQMSRPSTVAPSPLGQASSLAGETRENYVSSSSQGALVPVTIGQGWSATAIARLLADSGIITNASSFLSAVMAAGAESSLTAGTHYLQPGMSDARLIALLRKAPGDEAEVSIYAGYTLSDIDTYLASRSFAQPGDFLREVDNLVEQEGLGFGEGWLMAGTYTVPLSDAARSLVTAMYHATLLELRPVLRNISDRDMTVEEVVIIASMITGETKNPAEMPVISGIIQNRLAEGIPLGIDATTRYETGNRSDPIPASVFEKRTPYNTRRVAGLPPTGICSPSPEALMAAASPQKTAWYYYLHDLSGTIRYAVDYEGHKRNIAEYLGR